MTQDVRQIDLPRTILIGRDLTGRVPGVLNELNLEGAATILADETTWQLAGHAVQRALEDDGIETTRYTVGEASLAEVERVKAVAAETTSRILIGVGGGTVIDVTKLSAFQDNKAFISVPTVASHDGIASGRASIVEKDARHSIAVRSPIAVIADLDIIEKAPHRFIAAGSGDILSKKTAIKDWELAHRLKGEPISQHASALAAISAEHIIAQRDAIGLNAPGATETVIKALMTSSMAMCIANSSRPASGAEHLFSHALDRIAGYPALHGEQVGVGTMIMAYLHGLDWQEIRDTLAAVGAPTTAKQLNVSTKQIVEALKMAHTMRPERYTILGADGITEEAAQQAVRVTGVGED